MLRILATYSITQNIVWPGKQRAGGGGRKPLCSLAAWVFLGIQTSHFTFCAFINPDAVMIMMHELQKEVSP